MVKMMKFMVVGLMMHIGYVHASDVPNIDEIVAQAGEQARQGLQQRYQGRLIDHVQVQELTQEIDRVSRAVYDEARPFSLRVFNPELVRRYGLTQEMVQDLVGHDFGVYPTVDGFMIGMRTDELSQSPDSESERENEQRIQEQLQHERRAALVGRLEQQDTPESLAFFNFLINQQLSSSSDPSSSDQQTSTPLQRFRTVYDQQEALQTPEVVSLNPFTPHTPLTSPHTPAGTSIERSPFVPSRISFSTPGQSYRKSP